MGELGLWYRLAELAVIGGSLTEEGVGGHNPLEPARLGCPFISGPEVSAWPVYEALETAPGDGAPRPSELAGWFSLRAPAASGDPALAAMAARPSAFAAAGDAAAGEAVERVLGLLAR